MVSDHKTGNSFTRPAGALSAREGLNYVHPVTISLYKAYFNVGFHFICFEKILIMSSVDEYQSPLSQVGESKSRNLLFASV